MGPSSKVAVATLATLSLTVPSAFARESALDNGSLSPDGGSETGLSESIPVEISILRKDIESPLLYPIFEAARRTGKLDPFVNGSGEQSLSGRASGDFGSCSWHLQREASGEYRLRVNLPTELSTDDRFKDFQFSNTGVLESASSEWSNLDLMEIYELGTAVTTPSRLREWEDDLEKSFFRQVYLRGELSVESPYAPSGL